ncbi:pentapeptide repeat-containing protein [Microbulbifer sp. CnH-101-E]|uniref:pentapeptide repeat-containing protein n=1 Tax=unclassified Microbulbifer TaxID=2619833 RepID=UPI004039F72F
MNEFNSRWKTDNGAKKAIQVVTALQSDKPLDEYLFEDYLTDKYSVNDRDFDQLFDLRGLEIEGENFSDCSLSYLNLSYCTFINCNFSRVNMFNSRVHESYFKKCEFVSCELESLYGNSAKFDHVKWGLSSFSSSYFINSEIVKSTILDCDFSSSRLVLPDFRGSAVKNSDFSWARIAPTKSFIMAVSENKKTINLNSVEWLNSKGKVAKDPFEASRLFDFLSLF